MNGKSEKAKDGASRNMIANLLPLKFMQTAAKEGGYRILESAPEMSASSSAAESSGEEKESQEDPADAVARSGETICSFNSGGLAALEQFLRTSQHTIVCAQETGITPD